MRHAYHQVGLTDLSALVQYAKKRKGETTVIHHHGITLTAYVGDRTYQMGYDHHACVNLGCFSVKGE